MKPKEENTAFRFQVCDFCLQDEYHNKFGEFEEMLICKDCDAKAHPSCMKYSNSLAEKALSYPWQCIECKTCVVCCTASNDASILFCDGCDKAYHMTCHQPNLLQKPDGIWICHSCTVDRRLSNDSDFVEQHNGHSFNFMQPSTSNESTNTLDFPFNVKQEAIPDVSTTDFEDWSAQDVTNYFSRMGFPDQAPVFLREEIDGKSLLLLKRSDVVEGLSLKLGPAVKLYDQIAKLQNFNASNSTYSF